MGARVVVGAAVLDGAGRLLAARRTAPPALAGGWELPGGKVEAGESDEDALARELREELGVEVAVGARVPGEWPLPARYVLRVYRAVVVGGEPRPLTDHDQLRWVEREEWLALPWLAADLPAVTALRGG